MLRPHTIVVYGYVIRRVLRPSRRLLTPLAVFLVGIGTTTLLSLLLLKKHVAVRSVPISHTRSAVGRTQSSPYHRTTRT